MDEQKQTTRPLPTAVELLAKFANPWTCAVTINAGYNTYTLSLPTRTKKRCPCGAIIPKGEGVAFTQADKPYAGRRALRLCLPCAQKRIAEREMKFYQFTTKDYPHFSETLYNDILPGALVADVLGLVYAHLHGGSDGNKMD